MSRSSISAFSSVPMARDEKTPIPHGKIQSKAAKHCILAMKIREIKAKEHTKGTILDKPGWI